MTIIVEALGLRLPALRQESCPAVLRGYEHRFWRTGRPEDVRHGTKRGDEFDTSS